MLAISAATDIPQYLNQKIPIGASANAFGMGSNSVNKGCMAVMAVLECRKISLYKSLNLKCLITSANYHF